MDWLAEGNVQMKAVKLKRAVVVQKAALREIALEVTSNPL